MHTCTHVPSCPALSPTPACSYRSSLPPTGNIATDGNTVMGREVISATYEGARAAAGTGVSYMADEGDNRHHSMTGNRAIFRPRHTQTRGSTAFTDVSGTSSAVSGQGNGPMAMATGLEVAAFARSHRNREPVKAPADGFDGNNSH